MAFDAADDEHLYGKRAAQSCASTGLSKAMEADITQREGKAALHASVTDESGDAR
jgi:hypothetical protein